MKRTPYTLLISTVGSVFLFAQRVMAQAPPPDAPTLATLANALTISAKILRATAYGLAVGMVIYAGILYLTAYGDENKPTQAKNIIKGVAIGLLFVILAQVIVLALLQGVSPDEEGQREAIQTIFSNPAS